MNLYEVEHNIQEYSRSVLGQKSLMADTCDRSRIISDFHPVTE